MPCARSVHSLIIYQVQCVHGLALVRYVCLLTRVIEWDSISVYWSREHENLIILASSKRANAAHVLFYV